MRNFVALTFFIGLFTLSSCEGGTTYSKTIENHTSETLTVLIYSAYGGFESPVSINPNETKNIWIDIQMGSFAGDAYTCTQEFDSVTMSVSNNKTLSLDIMDAGNWRRESSGGRNSNEHCIL